MITLFSYLLTFLGIIFWVFRVITTLLYQLDVSFFATPLNTDTEILVLFLTIPCMLFVIKRNIVGAAAYAALYVAYYGAAVYNSILAINQTGLNILNSTDTFLLSVGVLISVLTFFDIFINKNRAGFGGDKKTDWYYKNEKYDRKFDERADRNQYKF